jgi:hypothetical protein
LDRKSIHFYDKEAVPTPLSIRFGATLAGATLEVYLLTQHATLSFPAIYHKRRARWPAILRMQDCLEEFAIPAPDDDQPRQ